MSLLEHLEELRSRLIWVFGAVGFAAVAGWFGYELVVELLLEPARPYLQDLADGRLIVTSPLEAFTLRLKVALYIGFAIAFPLVLYHLWRFVSPGLHKRERRYAIPFILSGIVLFAGGVVFAYMTLPQALRFLIGDEITGQSVSPLLNAKSYIDFGLLYHAAFGLAFEFPVLLMGLALLRVINSKQMARYRRQVFLGISVAAAVLTPSADWITMLALSLSLYVMYEACIWLSRLFKR